MHDALVAARGASARGDVAGAARILERALDGGALLPVQRTALLEELVKRLVTASRHAEALARALQLEQHIGLKQGLPLLPGLFPWLLSKFPGAPGSQVVRALRWALRIRPLAHGGTMATVRAVQFARFWHDGRAFRRLSLVQLAMSRSADEVGFSLLRLGFSLAHADADQAGLRLLRSVLARAHRQRQARILAEGYPLLAIAYQMCGQPRRALHYLQLSQRRYPHDSTFYQLLSRTNLLGITLSLGRWSELGAQLDACFADSFALDSSRHHMQIYGVRAVLLAAAGEAAQSVKAIAAARIAAEANDNALDFMVYLRFAALAALLAGDHATVIETASRGLVHCRSYGGARWYRQEFRALLASARQPAPGTPYYARLVEVSRRYVGAELRRQQARSAAQLPHLTEQLEEALRSHFDFDPLRPPTIDDLAVKLARTFKSGYVASAPEIAALEQKVRRDQRIASPRLTARSDDELRFVCPDGRFVLGLRCNKTAEFRDELAVCVLLDELDPLSESLVKAAFRLVLAQYVFVHSISIARERQVKQQRAAAAGLLAQMFAHDVRRPFHMLRTALDVLGGARDLEEFRHHARRLLPEVEAATQSADVLIADVMEMGDQGTPRSPECVPPERVILAAMLETLRGHPEADVSFEYRFGHRGVMCAEVKNTQRVFANILANALAAMGGRGHITFSTWNREHGDHAQLEFAISNDGPAIAKADEANLFEPFFTRNKPTGTGLGLAIAARIVAAHGGRIWHAMPPAGGAAFHFTLPAAAAPAPMQPAPQLPAHSRELTPSTAPVPRGSAEGPADLPEVAIVDDSSAFLVGWHRALSGDAHACCFASPEAFFACVDRDASLLGRLTAVITDYRFTNSRHTGVSFARLLKAERPDLPVIISSSGVLSPRELGGVIDRQLEKGTMTWSALRESLIDLGAHGSHHARGVKS